MLVKHPKIKAGLIAGALFLLAQFIYQVVLSGPYNLGVSLVMAAIVIGGSVVGQHVISRRKS